MNIKTLLIYLLSFSCYADIGQVDEIDFKIDSIILLNDVDTVTADKGAPHNIDKGEGINSSINTYNYNDFTLYVHKNNNTILAYEIDTPSLVTSRGIKVGDTFKSIIDAYPYNYKSESYSRCGPYDTSFKNYTHYVYYTLIYKEADAEKWKGKIITFFLKDDVITRIFIYQGEGC